MKSTLVCTILVVISAFEIRAQQPSPGATPEKFVFRFALAEETGQAVVVMGNRVFLTLDGLKQYIQTLAPKSEIYLKLTDQRFPKGNLFLGSRELDKFCADRNIKLETSPPGFW